MTEITFVTPDGTTKPISAVDGNSVMQTAVANNVAGIVAECGGAMACATCHVYIDKAFADIVGEASEEEAEMLEFAACDVRETSRLSCQIKISPQLDGLVVYLPDSQV